MKAEQYNALYPHPPSLSPFKHGQILVGINHKGMGFDDLLVALQEGVANGGDRLQKQAIGNIARFDLFFFYLFLFSSFVAELHTHMTRCCVPRWLVGVYETASRLCACLSPGKVARSNRGPVP